MKTEIILSCEHATNSIPEKWEPLFASHKTLLHSHRGMDFGSSELSDFLSRRLSSTCVKASVSRLLIDCNRSIGHPNCFSEITRDIPEKEKHEIIQAFYLPFRRSVEHSILEEIKAGKRVHHFSIHSFTPVMDGIIRNTDIGLLYDPGRRKEKMLANALKNKIKKIAPELRVRMNYPYLGISNGFTRVLRKLFSENRYTGIEIEINQSITGHSFEENGYTTSLPPMPAFETIKEVLAVVLAGYIR